MEIGTDKHKIKIAMIFFFFYLYTFAWKYFIKVVIEESGIS